MAVRQQRAARRIHARGRELGKACLACLRMCMTSSVLRLVACSFWISAEGLSGSLPRALGRILEGSFL